MITKFFLKIGKPLLVIVTLLAVCNQMMFIPFNIGFGVGLSMFPTLSSTQFSIGHKIYSENNIYYGSIVDLKTSLYHEGFKTMSATKRIIGKPYDQIDVIDNQIYRNGVLLNETYILPTDRTYNRHFTLSENEYLVMGDNRDNSTDSRSFGIVTYDQLQSTLTYTINLL